MSNIISVGDTYRLFGSEVKTHKDLPAGTYTVQFNPMDGFSLSRVTDLKVGNEKVYGSRDVKVDKIMHSFRAMNRSLGVMLSGDKGQGESLFLRMLADKAVDTGLPVIRVTRDYSGLADFIDSLGECMVVFDEFEKVFQAKGEDGNRQNQFLSMFDGVSSVKRIYCITVNDLRSVSNYLVNRPGRFHYHMRFDYPGSEQIREYISDQAPEATDGQIDSIITFSKRVNLNYDHLRAIAFELNLAPKARVHEIIEDLNIKPMGDDLYAITIHFDGGGSLSTRDHLNLFGDSDEIAFSFMSNSMYLGLKFNRNDMIVDADSDLIVVDGDNVEYNRKDLDLVESGQIDRIELRLVGQYGYSYGAF